MKKASLFFSKEDQQAIAAAIEEAEQRTSGEIVPVLATASGRYDRAEDIVGLLAGLVVLSLGWLYCPAFHASSGWPADSGMSASGLFSALGCVVIGFVIGSALASRFPVLRLPFIPAREMKEDVYRAAQSAFVDHQVRSTREATGVLLYMSLYERRVVVLPDEGLLNIIPESAWESVRDLLIDGLKKGQGSEGVVNAINACSDLLAEHLPVKAGDQNELPNTLRVLD